MTIAGTWNDGDASSQRDLPTLVDEFRDWTGDLDVAVGGTVLKSDESYAAAAQGAYLDRWTAMAKNLQALRGDKPGITYVRPFHEFNGDWYKNWTVTPDRVDDYKASFQLMARTIREHCPRCKIVWSPNNGTSGGSAPVAAAWPGDEYVDVVGVDSYNANGATVVTDSRSWDEYANATDGPNPVGPEAWRKFAEEHGKPIAFPEWGLNHAEGGGDDPAYIQEMHDWMVQHAARPGDADVSGKVVYDVYFNIAMDDNDGFLIKDGPNPESGRTYTALRWGNTAGADGGSGAGAAHGTAPVTAPVTAVTLRDARLGAVGVTAAAQAVGDLPYAGTSPSQKLDLYLPQRGGTAVPLVVLVHGGAFSEGDKRDKDVLEDARALFARGFAVAIVNYRLSGEAAFPAGIQDVKAAVRWLRAHAAEYGIDPTRMAAWGDSAGGYLASMLGVTGGQADRVLDDASLGAGGISSAVQAVVDFYGPSDFAAMDGQLAGAGCAPDALSHSGAGSPESAWLRTSARNAPDTADPRGWAASAPAGSLPPFLIAHGDRDCVVPAEQSTALSEALKQRGADVQLRLVAGAGHDDRAITEGLRQEAVAFLERHLVAAAPSLGAPADAAPAAPAGAPALIGGVPVGGAPIGADPAGAAAPPAAAVTRKASTTRTTPPPVRSSGS